MHTPSDQPRIGVVHGRFQGLHRGHAEYLVAARERCDRLIVGITAPNRHTASSNAGDSHRSQREHNPFTFYERLCMVEACLTEAGYRHDSFDVVPFPIEEPADLSEFIPSAPEEVTHFMTIYDRWGDYKLRTLRSLGYSVEVMWRRTDSTRVASGTEVRRRMRSGEDWAELMTPGVADVVRRLNLEGRLRAEAVLYGTESSPHSLLP